MQQGPCCEGSAGWVDDGVTPEPHMMVSGEEGARRRGG